MLNEVRLSSTRVGNASLLCRQAQRYLASGMFSPSSRLYAEGAVFVTRISSLAARNFMCAWYAEYSLPGNADRDQAPLAFLLNQRAQRLADEDIATTFGMNGGGHVRLLTGAWDRSLPNANFTSINFRELQCPHSNWTL